MNLNAAMNLFRSTVATCQFELVRSLTYQRMSASLVMMFFPPAMLVLIFASPFGQSGLPLIVSVTLTLLLIGLVTMLSLLLWATPNVHSELEGKSWIFIASRPGGRIACFLGKYLASVISTFLVSWAAITMCIFISSRYVPMRDPLELWANLSVIFLIACLVYSAVFSMIGTLFIKRAMVVGVAYVLVSEIFVAFIPAIIGKITARFHLQSLFFGWVTWILDGEMKTNIEMLYGKPNSLVNLLSLFMICAVCLAIGMFTIVSRQYITSDES